MPPKVWFALKKSLPCKSEALDVHDPKPRNQLSTMLKRRRRRPCGGSGCSRSIENLKDVIHGGKRHTERPTTTTTSCSPRSIGSSEFLGPIAHEVVLNDSMCELKITHGCAAAAAAAAASAINGGGDVGATFVGSLRPGTPGPSYLRKSSLSASDSFALGNGEGSNHEGCFSGNRASSCSEGGSSQRHSTSLSCHKCGKQFLRWDALEEHHLSKHAVTELQEGDSCRRIVEIICKASWLKSEISCGRIERVLKVHNMQRTLARFEEYRETVKLKASKLSKKHPRCLADGNELLRFFCTTIYCSLGTNSSSNLCTSSKCNVCRIIRHGFSTKKEMKDGIGVFTTSTSKRALETIEINEDDASMRKALLICRVIAGRVHKPMENLQDFVVQPGFDSVAGRVGLYSNIEELYLLNPRALLPCFVVISRS
ncbi:uncharacterized protein LOC109724705 [Ananas comosus]|uniref:Uncharacterized protein LOC109724705 n=1 Tax=Ananas comosus TaxID=4615 RepID=A0A199UFL7_ANACO|nr:uncharacterized protein LOC109724705 [Ananas comosus]OAY63538.1 hypothetical protein ACMD2_00501 [Ananas comosus]